MLNFDGRVYPKICVLIDFSFAMMEMDLILAWLGTEAFVWATFHFTPAAWLASADLSNFVILIFYRFSRQEMEKSLTQQQKDLSIRWAWCQTGSTIKTQNPAKIRDQPDGQNGSKRSFTSN